MAETIIYTSDQIAFEKNDTSGIEYIEENVVDFEEDEELAEVAEEVVTEISERITSNTVVQIDMEGNELLTNTTAHFANSKEQAKEILGSVEKTGKNELLIGDSVNQRAIVVDLNTSDVVWQYDADRYVMDFHLNLQDEKEITIYDTSISESETHIRQGTNLIWKNESSSPVSIYSGYTTSELFAKNPNLNLYGEHFKSETLQPGESYTFKFEGSNEFNWFVYPTILTGIITVSKYRLSNDDEYVVLEGDGLNSPFSSRVVKLDYWGNKDWSFGEGYLVKPRDARPLINNRVIIST